MASDILIVDDEADIRDLVAGILSDEGFTTRTARDSDSALAEISNRRPHLVFLDIWLQGSKLDGLQLLGQIKRDHADLPVVMISGHGNIETAVAAIKRGAYDFIEKPFKSDRLILPATRAHETSRLKREVKELKQLAPAASDLTGRSDCMNQLRQTIARAAKANSRIMIVGPSGADRLFHGSDFRCDWIAQAPDRPGRNGGVAVACLAGKRPSAPQQCRACDDSRRRRSRSDHHGRYAAAGCGLHGACHADQQQRRAHHGVASARGEGSIRARLLDRPDQPLLRQYFAYGRVCRHGAFGSASQAQSARGGVSRLPSSGFMYGI